MSLLALFVANALAAPAMVTTSKGEVKLDGTAAAPAAPYLLEEGQSLHLAAGAEVVVLYQGAATQLKGPLTLKFGDLQGAQSSDGGELAALENVMGRASSVSSVGATRADGEVVLARPLASSTVVQPLEIQWRCAETCPESAVEIYSFRDDEVVWAGTGSGAARYDGPVLSPGPYAVKVGAVEFSFKVAKKEETETLAQARKAAEDAAKDLPEADRVAVVAAVYMQAGLPSEALAVVDTAIAAKPEDPELKALRARLEERVGL